MGLADRIAGRAKNRESSKNPGYISRLGASPSVSVSAVSLHIFGVGPVGLNRLIERLHLTFGIAPLVFAELGEELRIGPARVLAPVGEIEFFAKNANNDR